MVAPPRGVLIASGEMTWGWKSFSPKSLRRWGSSVLPLGWQTRRVGVHSLNFSYLLNWLALERYPHHFGNFEGTYVFTNQKDGQGGRGRFRDSRGVLLWRSDGTLIRLSIVWSGMGTQPTWAHYPMPIASKGRSMTNLYKPETGNEENPQRGPRDSRQAGRST